MGQGHNDNKLILASNRGPVVHVSDESGELQSVRGGGGLVSALLGVSASQDVTWIASSMTPEDAEVGRRAGGKSFTVEHDGHRLGLRYIVADPDTYHKFYNIIANPMIWFIQHYLWDLAIAPEIGRNELDAWENGYQVINRMFADALCDELERHEDSRPLVMIHDYHLYTCPAMVREKHPEAFLHQFIHTPWPQPDSWRVLPRAIREEIIRGVLANDIVAFHTAKYARNFLACCRELLGLDVGNGAASIMVDGREVWVRAYPVAIDCDEFERLAVSAPVLAEEEKIVAARREQLILRVDRMDLSKNIVRGFRAYDLLLDEHPEYREKVTFLALMQPSREDVPEYAAYRERIASVVDEVNDRHGTGDWMPIEVHMQDNFPCSVAAYKQYDVLLVNAIFDGMNLIAKEAGLVNRRDGVLLLSENTGAHEELAGSVISINPFDLIGQAEAMHRALTMPEDEKKRLAGMLKETVRNNDINKWINDQFRDIKSRTGGDR